MNDNKIEENKLEGKKIFIKDPREVEVKVNDKVRILIKIDDSMDPSGFLEMFNTVKFFVKQGMPETFTPMEGGVVRRSPTARTNYDRQTPSQVQIKIETVAKYYNEGLDLVQITTKLGNTRTWVQELIKRAKRQGLIKQ